MADYWNIMDYGAQQGQDITSILQSGINTQPTHNLPVYIPGFQFELSSTVTIGSSEGFLRGGGQIVTAGCGDPMNSGDDNYGAATRLYWNGDQGQAMFKIAGDSFEWLGGATLVGHSITGNEDKAGTGIVITKDGKSGLGTGKFYFEAMDFFHFETGIRSGNVPNEANCESNYYERLGMYDCDIGFLIGNSQGMLHYIGFLDSDADTQVLTECRSGGILHVENATCYNTLFKLPGADPGGTSPSIANASFRFENTFVPADSSGNFVALDNPAGVRAHVVYNVGHIADQNYEALGGTLIKARGPCSVSFYDWYNIQPASISGNYGEGSFAPYYPNIFFERCRLTDDDSRNLIKSDSGPIHLTVAHCMNLDGQNVNNINDYSEKIVEPSQEVDSAKSNNRINFSTGLN